jgi:hypothetical protein
MALSTALVSVLLLAGCKEEALNKCLLQSEQITAMRRLSANAELTANLEHCEKLLGHSRQGVATCEATYLDADTRVRACMEAEYYVPTGCHFGKFEDPACYEAKIVAFAHRLTPSKVIAAIRSRFFRPDSD